MRLLSITLLAALVVPVAALAQSVKQVEVINLPAVQNVTGTVEVTNDATNPVEVVGEVAVTNLPTPTAAARYQFVGFTGATFDGGQGVGTYTLACQSDFSSEARMCTSVEVLETVAWPAVSSTTRGWVRPVFLAGGDIVDASGLNGSGAGHLSCGGWSFSSNTRSGLAVSGYGRFVEPGFNSSCDVARPIACCAPVP